MGNSRGKTTGWLVCQQAAASHGAQAHKGKESAQFKDKRERERERDFFTQQTPVSLIFVTVSAQMVDLIIADPCDLLVKAVLPCVQLDHLHTREHLVRHLDAQIFDFHELFLHILDLPYHDQIRGNPVFDCVLLTRMEKTKTTTKRTKSQRVRENERRQKNKRHKMLVDQTKSREHYIDLIVVYSLDNNKSSAVKSVLFLGRIQKHGLTFFASLTMFNNNTTTSHS